jgi:hypothetical protein
VIGQNEGSRRRLKKKMRQGRRRWELKFWRLRRLSMQ